MFAFVMALLLAATSAAHAQTKLLRFPDIHGDRVVFTYGGDLWIASIAGGNATRLTAHPGVEVFAKFSPDGNQIAFTAQYDGDEQVYVIPATGGEPRQLSYYPARGPLTPRWGYDNQVYGWTNDGKSILFRSHRDSWTLPMTRLYTVAATGGNAEPLPMPESGAGDFSPDGTRIVYSPRARDFRTEKRYGGGQANDLYIFDVKTYAAERIADHPRADRDPMWINDRIYFNSDRDGHFNLYAYDLSSKKTEQITRNRPQDVRWPSSDRDGRIVYELAGELNVYDTRNRRNTPLKIFVPDEGLWKRPSRGAVASLIQDVALSPKGERVLFGARGDIFSAPVERGPVRNLTRSSNANDKWARWSPDGTRVAFISDRTGEEELYVITQDGTRPAEQITTGGTAMRYAPAWSPDGTRITFGDKDGKVYVVTLADKRIVEIVDAPRGQIRDYTWSPRGNHLAFSMADANGSSSIHIWSARDNQLRRGTDETFSEFSPAWDTKGEYLYYLSNREFAPQISAIEFNYATNRETYIYALALRRNVRHPFPPESDEVAGAQSSPSPTPRPAGDAEPVAPKEPAEDINRELKGQGGQPSPTPAPSPSPATSAPNPASASDLVIDFDGLAARVARVPVEANNYGGLSAKAGHLLYGVGPGFYYGRSGGTTSLRIFSMKDRKETTLAEDIRFYVLSEDGSKLLAAQGPAYNVYDAAPGGDKSRKTVPTTALAADRIPTEEWNQIFNEVWRRYRDWFYVENMHGYDWAALRERYRPLLAHVAHRSDLNYVIGEMIAELAVQHAYIEGGDFQLPPRARVALPGARFELDRAAGRFRISKIYEGQNEEDIYRSPLKEVGVNVSVGEYVLAIDGEELKGTDDPYRLLRNKADNPVSLTVNRAPTMEGARTISFRPITEEGNLIYLDWVNANRRRVAEMTNNRVGYLHVPDMGANGIREFIKWYYPQIRKQGLVVDVRANGGGNVSRMLIERLRRRVLALQFPRTSDEANTYPDAAFAGPMAAILNENSSSDGDIFPAMFREAGLGPLIGKRSWGGVVGITNRGALIDGGGVSVPEFGFANAKGEWIIEGYGVDPDIEIDNEPRLVIEGRDPQLERAVAEVMKRLPNNPAGLPRRPAPPVRTN